MIKLNNEKFSKHYASKFSAGNCPLKMQVKFSEKENIKRKGFKKDPLGESNAETECGVLQKYKGRLLLLASDECAINCRFCFRRNMERKKFGGTLQIKDKSIKEVILSGGDPLMLKDSELKTLFSSIPKHIRIRIHSRLPIALPARFTPALFNLFKQLENRLVFVVHVNHPNELDLKSEAIFKRLAECNATLLNQSVLLKGINDNAKTLAKLSEKLFSQRVLPYYLHILDKAEGTAHFEVPASEAKTIFKELKNMLPGYLVPRLVREVKGEGSKRWAH